jgi:hypothetical protein
MIAMPGGLKIRLEAEARLSGSLSIHLADNTLTVYNIGNVAA